MQRAHITQHQLRRAVLAQTMDEDQIRFWEKVDKSSPNGCWEWTAAHNEVGYGKFRLGGANFYAHRVSAMWAGMIDSAKAPLRTEQHIKGFVLHKCDNPKCVNPEHLWIGNASDNQKDAYQKGRHTPPNNKEWREKQKITDQKISKKAIHD